MQQLKPWEELTITDDFMFCKVMSDSALCKELLEMWFWLADTVSMEHANEIFSNGKYRVENKTVYMSGRFVQNARMEYFLQKYR